MGDFGDSVREWTEEAKVDMLAVFQRAVVLLGQEMNRTRANGGNMPHVTGTLMNSLLARIGPMPETAPAGTRFAGSDVGLIAAQAELGDVVSLGFRAIYAARINYGFQGQDSLGRNYNQEGAHFIERAADMWPQLVDQAVADVKNGVGV